jgi:acyl carrier protein
MEAIMEELRKALSAALPEWDGSGFSSDMVITETPGWDSMNAINFVMEIQQIFHVNIEDLLLKPGLTVGEIKSHLHRMRKGPDSM